MRIVAAFVAAFVAIGNAQSARYIGSVIQPNTVPPGSCCLNTGLVKFDGIGSVPDVILPIDWLWSFDVSFDPTQGITINSITVSSLSDDYFPDQPNLTLNGLFQFEYPVGLEPLSPTATPNEFTTGQITPQSLRVQGTWNNFGVETEIDSVITAGVGNSHAFVFDFSNFPESIDVTCNGAICNRADFAAPANVFEAPSIIFPPYYSLGLVRSYMSKTAELIPASDIPSPLIGDYNRNGTVDAPDYTIWRDLFGTLLEEGTGPDGNNNGFVDSFDRLIWQENFGNTNVKPAATAVPDSTALALALIAIWSLIVLHPSGMTAISRW